MLVADDEPDVRLLLRLGLRHHDIAVVGEAADGFEVLEVCNSQPVDAIVLDLLMPKMNGFEVIPELQRDHPTIGIVAYTAVAGDFVRREMARLNIPLLLKSGDAAPSPTRCTPPAPRPAPARASERYSSFSSLR